MIKYPELNDRLHIGVTAPSSGVSDEMKNILEEAVAKMEDNKHKVTVGATSWLQDRVRSTTALERANELNLFLQSSEINLVFPPFGGELLIEILEYIEFDKIKPKWILGYSDISLLLFVITLKTGIATAHDTNIVDLRGEHSDETTKKWLNVLHTRSNEKIIQYSSEKYQKDWDYENLSPDRKSVV